MPPAGKGLVKGSRLQHTRGHGKGKEKLVRNFPHAYDHEYLCLRQNVPVHLCYTLHKRQITRVTSAPNVTHMRFFSCWDRLN